MKITMNRFFNMQTAAFGLPMVLAVLLRPDCAMLLVVCIWAVVFAALRIYDRLSWADRAGRCVLLTAAALLGCGVVLNQWYFTTYAGATDCCPVLQNHDADDYWTRAVGPLQFGLNDTHAGYPLLLRCLFVLRPTLTIPLALNMLATLLTVILAGGITRRVVPTTLKHAPTAAMIVTAANCYFMVCGTLLLKDALLNLIIAATALLLLRMRQADRPERRDVLALVGLFLFMGLLRLPMVAMMCVGVVALVRLKRSHLYTAVGLLILGGAIWGATKVEAALDASVTRNIGNHIHGAEIAERQQPLRMLIGDFKSFGLLKRICFLPLFCLLQFLIPFPWNYGRDIIFGPTSAYAHVAYPGYLAGIILGYYVLWLLWPRRLHNLNRLLLWGAVCYCGIALMWSGTVSRYALAFIPLAAPAVAYTLLTCWRRCSLWVWTAVCAVLMTVGLLICHHLQTGG